MTDLTKEISNRPLWLAISLLTVLFSFFSCEENNHVDDLEYMSESLIIRKLKKGVYIHTSYLDTNDFGKVSCNGLIYFNGGQLFIADTPATEKASIELLEHLSKFTEIDNLGVVATHFHTDCTAGYDAFFKYKIASYNSVKSMEIANKLEITSAQRYFHDGFEMAVGKGSVEGKYFGEGHTSDNIVVYLLNEKVLFGGCLIKELGADQGNLDDANISEWALSVERLKQNYPDVEIVVPGHGKEGGKKLLDYTIKLFSGR